MSESKKEKLGYEGLTNSLKKANYEPIGVHDPSRYILSVTAPNYRTKKNGKIVVSLPDEVFNNKQDTRQLNQGKHRFLLLFVENIKKKKGKK